MIWGDMYYWQQAAGWRHHRSVSEDVKELGPQTAGPLPRPHWLLQSAAVLFIQMLLILNESRVKINTARPLTNQDTDTTCEADKINVRSTSRQTGRGFLK